MVSALYDLRALRAPGAGKGTLSAFLAQKYKFVHYSVGDGLRTWMRDNRSTTLAAEIRSKLDNQGFLTSKELNPFIYRAIEDASHAGAAGILVDGYPRCIEQLESARPWPFQDTLPLASDCDSVLSLEVNPDLVLSFQITKENARSRYLRRARDHNDSADKFERRFAEYELETIPVATVYQKRGLLISVDMNGTKEENITIVAKELQESKLWQQTVVEGMTGIRFLS
ncbi:adenylate kinase [Fusarium heterosporum]|uniref:Adenylate kinase n=1 Tax=Fusarium heterosporum TaxID=42747 RepID=A0A8H5TN66_FUSHE|nr:adenylate kinase [Fusarium heterosporum]